MPQYFTLDPSWPAAWETPNILRFGVETVVTRVHVENRAIEPFLTRLRRGAPVNPRERPASIPAQLWARLLSELAPVLVPLREGATAPVRHELNRFPRASDASRLIAFTGSATTFGDFARTLGAMGIEAGVAADHRGRAPSLIVRVHDFYPPYSDIPHREQGVPELHVRFLDRSVLLGPLVVPGSSPCGHCPALHAADADDSLAVIAPQLLHARAASTSLHTIMLISAYIEVVLETRFEDSPLRQAQMRFGVMRGIPELIPSLIACAPHGQCWCSAGARSLSSAW